MNMKEQLRVEIRKGLNKLETQCSDMASLLRGLGIHVGGGFIPLPNEVCLSIVFLQYIILYVTLCFRFCSLLECYATIVLIAQLYIYITQDAITQSSTRCFDILAVINIKELLQKGIRKDGIQS